MRRMIQPVRNAANAIKAVSTHIQVAYDLGREACWEGVPGMVDLLDGGRRKGFLESPDTLYSIGFINIERGYNYRVIVMPSRAFCTVISLHSADRQSSLEFFNDTSRHSEYPVSALLGDGLSGPDKIDSSAYSGMTQVMVRQYFYDRKHSQDLPLPVIERSGLMAQALSGKKKISARYEVTSKFLRWRLRMLFGMKYMQMRLGDKLPRNKFVTSEEVALLFRGIKTSLARIGISTFHYLVCMFDIRESQVMRIHYRPSKNRYFAFCLNNNWMQGLDIKNREAVHLNSRQMKMDREGGYTLYVGNQDPGLGNFLDLGDCSQGVISFREIGTEGEARRPHCEVLTYQNLYEISNR